MMDLPMKLDSDDLKKIRRFEELVARNVNKQTSPRDQRAIEKIEKHFFYLVYVYFKHEMRK